MRLAAILPVLDEERELERLLPRLLQGAGRDRVDEVCVVDGGSRDRSREVAQAAGARVLETPAARGLQLGAGARAASGDWLLFLHADSFPHRGALLELRKAATLGARLLCFRQCIAAEGRFYRWVEGAAARRARRGRIYGDSGLAVHREDYEAVGGYRPWPLFEDLELARRLHRRTPVRLLAGPLEVSPRRWTREGALRCTLRNWILGLGFRAGVSPERLVRLYLNHSQPPERG